MATLLERLRAARESWVSVGEYEVLVRRPTDVELFKARADDNSAFVRRVVVDWRKVRELDVVPGGAAHPVPFDLDLCVEWLEDRPLLYAELVQKVETIIRERFEARDDAEKK